MFGVAPALLQAIKAASDDEGKADACTTVVLKGAEIRYDLAITRLSGLHVRSLPAALGHNAAAQHVPSVQVRLGSVIDFNDRAIIMAMGGLLGYMASINVGCVDKGTW